MNFLTTYWNVGYLMLFSFIFVWFSSFFYLIVADGSYTGSHISVTHRTGSNTIFATNTLVMFDALKLVNHVCIVCTTIFKRVIMQTKRTSSVSKRKPGTFDNYVDTIYDCTYIHRFDNVQSQMENLKRENKILQIIEI